MENKSIHTRTRFINDLCGVNSLQCAHFLYLFESMYSRILKILIRHLQPPFRQNAEKNRDEKKHREHVWMGIGTVRLFSTCHPPPTAPFMCCSPPPLILCDIQLCICVFISALYRCRNGVRQGRFYIAWFIKLCHSSIKPHRVFSPESQDSVSFVPIYIFSAKEFSVCEFRCTIFDIS